MNTATNSTPAAAFPVRDPHFTLRIEKALRCFVRHPEFVIRYVEHRHNLESGSVSAWLAEFNEGKKILTDARIDEVKIETGSISNGKPEAKPAGIVRNCDPAVTIVSTVPSVTVETKSPAKLVLPTSNIGRWLEDQKVEIVGIVHSYLVKVPPQVADRWLQLNTGNRKPSKAKIRRFTKTMSNPVDWLVNGETLKFSVSGRVLDGQSRLMAARDSGQTIVFEVRGGLPDAAQKTMDCGELRKTSHTLEMLGASYPFEYAAALKLCWLLERGMLGGRKFKKPAVMENAEVPAMLEKHADLAKSIAWMAEWQEKIVLLMPKSEAAFFHYVFGTVDAELRDHFCEAMIEGANLTKLSPIFHLRNALLSARAQGSVRAVATDRRALIIKAWNATRAGDKLTSLRFLAGEAFPMIAGWGKGS